MDKMLWPLFSKPVFKAPVNISGLDFSQVKWAKNYNNWISESQRVIEEPQYAQFAESVFQNIYEYFHGVMQVKSGVEIYITESWLNKTEKGQSHHRHWHPNSVLSGIVYLDSQGETGRTKFITSNYDTFEFGMNDSNLYNSKMWSVVPEVGSMLLFPSNVEHMVEAYDGDTPRITMAFNTFVRGEINSDALTRLSV